MESVSRIDIRQSAKKVRHVLYEIKNSKVNDALTKLNFMNKKSAKFIHQTSFWHGNQASLSTQEI